ncbi:hypothetical protein [Comamonas koreensis]|uniref:hypothetical protein n=1 Tax=Comamonas koreensis TaxID=160825 RepID=UPI0015FC1163|nr:hypothetical protein [Comamonas koreensis]
MGQYHKVYNLDKREFIHPHRIDNGLKLLEQVGHMKSTSTALFLLLANSNGRGGGDAPKHELIGSWAGDRVLIQGDYAHESDHGYVDPEELEAFTDISGDVNEILALVDD